MDENYQQMLERFQRTNLNISPLVIEELYYIPAGYHVPVYKRPYVANMNGAAVYTLIDRMKENRLNNVNEAVLSGISKDLIAPSSQPVLSAINDSWVTEKRYMFILKCYYVDNFDMKKNIYLQGFTSHAGITPNGHADMEMQHYVNSVIETSYITQQTPFGIVEQERLLRIYDVLQNTSQASDIYEYTQRPYDIYFNLFNQELTNNVINGYAKVTDTRYTLSPMFSAPVGSSVKNNVLTSYIANVVNVGINNLNTPNFDETFESNSTYSINSSNEPNFTDNYFFKYLRMKTQRRGGNTFSFKDLFDLDTTIYDRFKLIELTKSNIDVFAANSPQTGEYWTGRDMITLTAYSVIEASVATALRYGFTKLYFTATNMADPLSTPYVIISSFNSFLKVDQDTIFSLLESFKQNFLNSIFMDETHGNTIPMELFVMVDIMGTTKVSIKAPGTPETWFTIPTFANSLFAPVVTVNKQAFDDLSHNVSALVEQINEA